MKNGLIAKGGFGEIYLAQKIDDKKLYALKVYKKSKIADQDQL